MATCLGKSSFGLLCVYIVNVYHFVYILLSRLMWDLIVYVPDHCLYPVTFNVLRAKFHIEM